MGYEKISDELFETAVEALIHGEATTLRLLLDQHPDLIRARSARPHKAHLLHYIGANGVEDERQVTPPNAVELTRMLLDAASALTNPGSLLSPHGEIVASYDLEVTNSAAEGYRALGLSNGICNAALAEFNPDYAAVSRVHVINGMGVTLGDSVIGLTALTAIKTRFPHISFTIYRPAHAPGYVKRLYELAAPLLGSVTDLPVNLDTLPYTELRIDLGNHLFWPKFSSLPMIDFFLDAMGIKANEVPAIDKRNHWLQELVLPRPQAIKGDYVLLCPTASTPVRSIPASMHKDFVEALWQRYRLPVAGFGNIDHMLYTDVTSRAPE